MKKITCLLSILLCAHISIAQIIFEDDFDGSGPGLAGWTVIDNDGNTINTAIAFITDGWVEVDLDGTDGNFGGPAGNMAAISGSWFTTVATADDWMITPAINVTTNNELTWDAKAQDIDYADGYEVRISTTGTDISTDFGTILYSIPAESDVWQTRTEDLAAYDGQTVYIAFRNTSTDKFLLLVDNVSVAVNNLSIDEFAQDSFRHFYNKDSNILELQSSNAVLDQLELFNILGQSVLNTSLSKTTETVNLSKLKDGIYLARVRIENQTQTFKIVKQ
jgi:hypothetical protein